MSLPMMKEFVGLTEVVHNTLTEAMMNVMQATFVILQSAPALKAEALSKGQQTFITLFESHFDKITV